MGAVLSCCVRCATYCHDEYNDWKYMDYVMPAASSSTENPNQIDAKILQRPTSSIFVAVQDGNRQEVVRHLTCSENSSASCLNSHHETPLHLTCSENSSASCLNSHHETPLHLTCSENSSASCLNSHHETPLHLACRLGYESIAICLVEHGCPVNMVTNVGSVLHSLIKAVKCGYISNKAGLSLALYLVGRGCDVNAVDKAGKTVLYYAVEASLEHFIRELLSSGANPNIAEFQYNFTSLHMAVCQGNISCLHALLESPELRLNAQDRLNRTPIILALLNVMEYVQHEPWPNVSFMGNSNLEDLIRRDRYSRIAVVEALITAGADLNMMDSDDRNPLVIIHTLLALELLRYGKLMGCDPGQSRFQAGIAGRSNFETVQESMFAPTVRLLVLFGARFPTAHQEMSFVRCADWMRKMYEENEELPTEDIKSRRMPRTLVNLCRLSVRHHLGKVSRLHCIEHLPLPSDLIDYVQIKYI